MITFEIPGRPVPWREPAQKGKQRFTQPAQRTHKNTVAWFARLAMKGQKPLSGPLMVRIAFIYEWPKTWTDAVRRQPMALWKTSRPDVHDNLGKLIYDGMNGIVYADDAQVAHSSHTKQYGTHARTVVTVYDMSSGEGF